MTTHITARIAWHQDGWNGHVCRNPAANTYCVGQFSYPGQMIAERRDLAWEQTNCGRGCHELDRPMPCAYSVNAFGTNTIRAASTPPDFFADDTLTLEWDIPAATVSIWPYEEMYYGEGVDRQGGGYDYVKRLEAARAYFGKIEPARSLIFYYANYSNPFSEDDNQRYVLVGMARIKRLGDELYYQNVSEETKKKYVGFVWQRNVTADYPNQGLRIPYDRYMDRPDVLDQILLVPSNQRLCKYATRHVSDDEALELVEQFLGAAVRLQEMGDTTENWDVRIQWLQSLIAELWDSRGLYPGLTKVLDVLDFGPAIQYFRNRVRHGEEQAAYDDIVAFLDGHIAHVPDLAIAGGVEQRVRRQWQLRDSDERRLLRDVLPRFDLYPDQIRRILQDDRRSYGIQATLAAVAENPYLMSEGYVGDDADDTISFSKIDRGVFPSPELGGEFWADRDAGHRLRALCVDLLKAETQHTFLPAANLIRDANFRLELMPEWKRWQYKETYFQVDEEIMREALTLRVVDERLYVYLKQVFEDERTVEEKIRFLVKGPDIRFRSPVTSRHWRNFLYQPNSVLVTKAQADYDKAIDGQVAVCERIFVRPVCVLSGGAGTGKTTVINALIQAIEQAHGAGASFQLLAPTGKAAERIREATGKPAATVHSFLARRGWLNDNMTFKRIGGQVERGISTYIIDEASMLNLELAAALFRSIDWTTVQRLILVGDPNQLPPIGRGRVFADIVEWFREDQSASIGTLHDNIRQMENRVTDKGTGILELASVYIQRPANIELTKDARAEEENLLRRVQEGGDISEDLRVFFWHSADDLARQLTNTIVEDMEKDTNLKLNPEKPWELWRKAFQKDGDQQRPEYQQVISPYRGELFGVEHLNTVLQVHSKGRAPDFHRQLNGITLFDKVIQYRNRPKSNPLTAWNTETRKAESVEVFNGELGFVKPHAFDYDRNTKRPKWTWSQFRIEHFQVIFSRKEHLWVNYGKNLGKRSDGRYIPSEDVEENLELAYAISVHKAQGSEFERVYFIVPKHKAALLSRELFYTGLTRAKRHCTIFVEEDITPLLTLRRPEQSQLARISSSLFEFRPVNDALLDFLRKYEAGRIHQTLADFMVRSKSEVIIANMLWERELDFHYELPLFAADGTFYLPDFTIHWRGQDWYWEHLGRMDLPKYRQHWEEKQAWYARFFPDQLLVTHEGGDLSKQANELIAAHFQ